MSSSSSSPFTISVSASSTLPLGALVQDAETPEQLPLSINVTGSLSQNATASVQYRRVGTSPWQEAAPMWRIQPQYAPSSRPPGVVDAFAGTIFDLDPGTSYEVSVTVTNSGNSDTRSGTFSTRALPPAAGAPTATVTTEAGLLSAFASASPGDVIQFSGEIVLSSGRIDFRNNEGTEQQPIYVRGDNRDTAILRGSGDVMRAREVNWIVFENMTLRGSGNNTGTSASNLGVEIFSDGSFSGGQTGLTFVI